MWSEEGRGSTFTIRLPVAAERAADDTATYDPVTGLLTQESSA